MLTDRTGCFFSQLSDVRSTERNVAVASFLLDATRTVLSQGLFFKAHARLSQIKLADKPFPLVCSLHDAHSMAVSESVYL